jgi:hypothetical protein
MEMKGKQQQANLLICNIYDEEWKSVIRKNIKATEKIYRWTKYQKDEKLSGCFFAEMTKNKME